MKKGLFLGLILLSMLFSLHLPAEEVKIEQQMSSIYQKYLTYLQKEWLPSQAKKPKADDDSLREANWNFQGRYMLFQFTGDEVNFWITETLKDARVGILSPSPCRVCVGTYYPWGSRYVKLKDLYNTPAELAFLKRQLAAAIPKTNVWCWDRQPVSSGKELDANDQWNTPQPTENFYLKNGDLHFIYQPGELGDMGKYGIMEVVVPNWRYGRYDPRIQHPAIGAEPKDHPTQSKIGKEMTGCLQEYLAEMEKEWAPYAQSPERWHALYSDWERRGEYRIVDQTPKYVSFWTGESISGESMKGNYLVCAGAFRKDNGQRLSLKDLYSTPQELEQLKKLVATAAPRGDIWACYNDVLAAKELTADSASWETPSLTENFYIKNGKIHFVYQQGELSGMSDGIMEIVIPHWKGGILK